MLTKEEIVQKLDSLQIIDKRMNEAASVISELFSGSAYEGNVLKAYTELMDEHIELLSSASGISKDAILWWIFEAEWGKCKYNISHSLDGKEVVLRNNAEFVDFEVGE
jgi:hypothetical protein